MSRYSSSAEQGFEFVHSEAAEQAMFVSGLVSGLISSPMDAKKWDAQCGNIANCEIFESGNGPQIKKLAANMLRTLADQLEGN